MKQLAVAFLLLLTSASVMAQVAATQIRLAKNHRPIYIASTANESVYVLSCKSKKLKLSEFALSRFDSKLNLHWSKGVFSNSKAFWRALLLVNKYSGEAAVSLLFKADEKRKHAASITLVLFDSSGQSQHLSLDLDTHFSAESVIGQYMSNYGIHIFLQEKDGQIQEVLFDFKSKSIKARAKISKNLFSGSMSFLRENPEQLLLWSSFPDHGYVIRFSLKNGTYDTSRIAGPGLATVPAHTTRMDDGHLFNNAPYSLKQRFIWERDQLVTDFYPNPSAHWDLHHNTKQNSYFYIAMVESEKSTRSFNNAKFISDRFLLVEFDSLFRERQRIEIPYTTTLNEKEATLNNIEVLDSAYYTSWMPFAESDSTYLILCFNRHSSVHTVVRLNRESGQVSGHHSIQNSGLKRMPYLLFSSTGIERMPAAMLVAELDFYSPDFRLWLEANGVEPGRKNGLHILGNTLNLKDFLLASGEGRNLMLVNWKQAETPKRSMLQVEITPPESFAFTHE